MTGEILRGEILIRLRAGIHSGPKRVRRLAGQRFFPSDLFSSLLLFCTQDHSSLRPCYPPAASPLLFAAAFQMTYRREVPLILPLFQMNLQPRLALFHSTVLLAELYFQFQGRCLVFYFESLLSSEVFFELLHIMQKNVLSFWVLAASSSKPC